MTINNRIGQSPASLKTWLCSFLMFSMTWVCSAQSIARTWNEEILAAIRIDLPHPPVHARNLFHLSVAMYDAWAAYDTNSIGYLYHGKHQAPDIEAARREAISYAAYRILSERYALSRNASNTLATLSVRMQVLGYATNSTSLDPSTPAGLGNLVAATVSEFAMHDGARQLQAYADLPPEAGGYVARNLPLITGDSGTLATNVNCWQRLAITNAVSQNGLPESAIQKFLGAQWLGVRPFALQRENSQLPWINPGPQPALHGFSHPQFMTDVVDIIRRSSELDPNDGIMIDISPGAFGNNSLGANDGSGHSVNPFNGQPYASNVVKRADFARVLAEHWADGPASETPPGHWNVIANKVADNPIFQKRVAGTGPVLGDLEWDVKTYFALNAALHDAACAAWSLKRCYDGGRPISFIRYMGQLGQSSAPSGPAYHPSGLPLVSNLIEVATFESARSGQRHAGFPIGLVLLRVWPGEPSDPTNQVSGARWIRAFDWLPYQKKTFVTPAFPGYVSGHSTFSRAAAEILTAITGSAFFPGGMGSFTAPANAYLTFERGPSAAVQLQWATYFDAADQAGLSRLWGGIHVPSDDLTGRTVGSECGQEAWNLARRYFDGTISNEVPLASIRRTANEHVEIWFNAVRGMSYELWTSSDLSQPFGVTLTATRASDFQQTFADPADQPHKWYRVVRVAP